MTTWFDELAEMEDTLRIRLEDFYGGDVTLLRDEGNDDYGVIVRIVAGPRIIELTATIKDVTEQLNSQGEE